MSEAPSAPPSAIVVVIGRERKERGVRRFFLSSLFYGVVFTHILFRIFSLCLYSSLLFSLSRSPSLSSSASSSFRPPCLLSPVQPHSGCLAVQAAVRGILSPVLRRCLGCEFFPDHSREPVCHRPDTRVAFLRLIALSCFSFLICSRHASLFLLFRDGKMVQASVTGAIQMNCRVCPLPQYMRMYTCSMSSRVYVNVRMYSQV